MTNFRQTLSLLCLVGLAASSLLGCNADDSPAVHVWAFSLPAKALREFAPDFEARHGRRLEVEAVPWGDMQKKILLAVAARSNVPDLVVCDPMWIGGLIAAGGLKPLDDSLSAGERARFFAPARETYEVGGRLYAAPLDVDMMICFWRRDLFDPYLRGMGLSDFPKTIDQFAQAARALVAAAPPDSGRRALLVDPSSMETLLMGLGPAFGVQWLSPDLKTAAFDSPNALRLVDFLVNAMDPHRGFALRWNARTDGDPFPLYCSGKVATVLAGPWFRKRLEEEAPDMAGLWRIAPLPVRDESCATGGLGGAALALPINAPDPQAGLDVLRLMLSPEFLKVYFTEVGSPPAVRDVWEWPEFSEPAPYFGGQRYFQVVRQAIESAAPMPLAPGPEALDAPVQWALNEALSGRLAPAEALKEAARRAQQAFDPS
ncbi:MAG: extracellular solute-binding protein [Candidatus Sumerlaeota bacterium]|nr:extracellular solute-binding protein [Candidatus Sumerlaeota bacterium]